VSGVEVRMVRSPLAVAVRLAGLLLSGLLLMAIPAVYAGEAGDNGAPTGHATVVYLVRHAEKASGGKDGDKDPGLTEAGRARALALARTLGDAGIGAIHSTDFKRTRQTAAPLAERLGIAVRTYDWDELQALSAAMRAAGGRHLVVGHSDTTPELVGLLGGEPGPAIDEPSEYDRLYIVTIGPDGAVASVMLRYGAPQEAAPGG
jgi:phosphohistidine phosphatase SixA